MERGKRARMGKRWRDGIKISSRDFEEDIVSLE